VENPLVRGGLTITAGLLAGNLLGFFRVAATAYLLGTRSDADSLAVSMGFADAVNPVVINTIVFAFVPMLAARSGVARAALFHKLRRLFIPAFALLTLSVAALAPWLIRALAPGLAAAPAATSVIILRIVALSSTAAGAGALYAALLFTERRFAPASFHQAILNVFTITGALVLWRWLGVYGFAVGYALGAWAQLAIVYIAVGRTTEGNAVCDADWRELIAKPGAFLFYGGLVASNLLVTRAYATHAGPGIAAALDYCMRCINVPLAYLISPISNSLLPEIARLRSRSQLREAFALIDRTAAFVALAAIAGCAIGIALREPLIALLFERGSFTPHSTRLVADVFMGLAPTLIGWSLLELTARSLFALDRPWLPVGAALVPVALNMMIVLLVPAHTPRLIGLGASVGLFAGFAVLFTWMHVGRRRWAA
jgi:putative peptidoglycan lipid II flippase